MSGLTPSAFIRSGMSRTRICRSRPPTTETLPTPSTVSRRRLMVSVASVVRSRSAQPLPESARLMIGFSRKSNREMIGGSMSSGRSARIRSIAERTSDWAVMIFVWSVNWMKIIV
jgi:hypothetical protein